MISPIHILTNDDLSKQLDYNSLKETSQPKVHIATPADIPRGLIIVGYPGVGKSSYSSSVYRTIDLESSNFMIDGERDNNWYKVYCNIAISLAKQGYIVFVSSHWQVVERLAGYCLDEKYVVAIVAPHEDLSTMWIEKLHNRYLEDQNNEKNRRAYEHAKKNFNFDIHQLSSQTDFPYIPIISMNYSFREIVSGLYSIYIDSSAVCSDGFISIS